MNSLRILLLSDAVSPTWSSLQAPLEQIDLASRVQLDLGCCIVQEIAELEDLGIVLGEAVKTIEGEGGGLVDIKTGGKGSPT